MAKYELSLKNNFVVTNISKFYALFEREDRLVASALLMSLSLVVISGIFESFNPYMSNYIYGTLNLILKNNETAYKTLAKVPANNCEYNGIKELKCLSAVASGHNKEALKLENTFFSHNIPATRFGNANFLLIKSYTLMQSKAIDYKSIISYTTNIIDNFDSIFDENDLILSKAYLYRGIANMKTGDLNKAESDFNKVIEFNTNSLDFNGKRINDEAKDNLNKINDYREHPFDESKP